MKTVHVIALLTLGSLFLAYDVWLIAEGHFRPETVLGLLVWIGLLFGVCHRIRTRRRADQQKAGPGSRY